MATIGRRAEQLDIQLSRPILVIGGLWDFGTAAVWDIRKSSGNIRDCLYSDTDYGNLVCR